MGLVTFFVLEVPDIDVIYYYVIWTDNGSTLPEANARRQEGKYPMIKYHRVASLVIIIFSQFSAHPLQDRQYAICHTFIIHPLFLLSSIWASTYPSTDALLYQSICSRYITSMVP